MEADCQGKEHGLGGEQVPEGERGLHSQPFQKLGNEQSVPWWWAGPGSTAMWLSVPELGLVGPMFAS